MAQIFAEKNGLSISAFVCAIRGKHKTHVAILNYVRI